MAVENNLHVGLYAVWAGTFRTVLTAASSRSSLSTRCSAWSALRRRVRHPVPLIILDVSLTSRRKFQGKGRDGRRSHRDQLVRYSRPSDAPTDPSAARRFYAQRNCTSRPTLPKPNKADSSVPHRCHPLPLPHPRPSVLHHPRLHPRPRIIHRPPGQDGEAVGCFRRVRVAA